MVVIINDTWFWFVIAFGIMLLSSILMGIQGRYFFTKDVVVRKFGIMDLEFAATPQELTNIINGIYLLPANTSSSPGTGKVIRALKGQLLVDTFLFMPAAYGSIFILCMKIASVYEAGHIGQIAFSIFAWMQILAFVLDGIENIYLYQKIRPNTEPSSKSTHKAFQLLEIFKWAIALNAAVCAFSQILYFWVSGGFREETLAYVLIAAIEIIAFFVIGIIVSKVTKRIANRTAN